MTIGIGKFNRSSNFLGPGPKKCRNKSMDFSEFQLVFGSPILFTYVGIEEPSTATISPEKPFSGFVLASTLYISSHLFFLLTWTKPKRGCYYTGARSTWNYFVLLTKKCYYGKWKWPLQNMDTDKTRYIHYLRETTTYCYAARFSDFKNYGRSIKWRQIQNGFFLNFL